ncbi:hypothetical protein PROFUN_10953 [Planoprotostelium fungivorum]|uniref:Uncharacterized protein n=1 Tax=Planoprotostelium fungivorum TaxID=1890364 RepID=A0A2P6NBW2_9EUKA|nr:hypothetical protein PROFUN_10953 [Planoprotostelium fungivorum]
MAHGLFFFLLALSAVGSLAQSNYGLGLTTNTTYANATAPDVLLIVPNLSVGLINLTVANLDVKLNLDAAVGNLVTITAGVSASIGQVSLIIQDVKAEAELQVRLNNVAAIVSRALDTVDKNPNLLTNLVKSISGLLNSVVNTLGQTVTSIVTESGDLLQKVVSSTGEVLSQNVLGSVLDLPIISNATNAFGQTVRTVKDTSGNLIDVTLNSAGQILNAQVKGGN